ncbi:MAG: Crp/Fnr family transcriptional regulator [Terriglobales bacterium]
MKPVADLEKLRQIPLFRGLDGPSLQALAALARPCEFEPGAMLFREGDTCGGVYVLLGGEVRIFKASAGGRELTLHRQSAPATMAEVPLVDGGPYPASVEAIRAVEALFLPRAGFLSVCRQQPQVALAALELFARRLRTLVALLEAVTFGGVRQRLARLLLERAPAGPMVATHQALALELGTVREVVSRNLSRFQDEGLIQMHGRASGASGRSAIEVLDQAGLAREATLEL